MAPNYNDMGTERQRAAYAAIRLGPYQIEGLQLNDGTFGLTTSSMANALGMARSTLRGWLARYQILELSSPQPKPLPGNGSGLKQLSNLRIADREGFHVATPVVWADPNGNGGNTGNFSCLNLFKDLIYYGATHPTVTERARASCLELMRVGMNTSFDILWEENFGQKQSISQEERLANEFLRLYPDDSARLFTPDFRKMFRRIFGYNVGQPGLPAANALNNTIWYRLQPGVHAVLDERNGDRDETGRRLHSHSSYLTDTGKEWAKQIVLASTCIGMALPDRDEHNTSGRKLHRMLDASFPRFKKPGKQPSRN